MKVGIYTNIIKDKGLEITRKLVALLKKRNFDYYLFSNVAETLRGEKYFYEADYAFLDVMITIGGDGTVLNIAKDCVKHSIPMLSINKGSKGFLNEIELDELERVFEILDGEYKIDRRRLISVTVTKGEVKKSGKLKGATRDADADANGKKGGKKIFYALNEAYITRISTGKMIYLNAKIENHLLEQYYCDGLIVSSATGSTAYSLSAGGPVISPKAEVICLTPVCPHTLHSRPIILNDRERVQVLLGADYDDAVLVVDGVTACGISASDTVEISTSNKSIDFLRLKESNFYAKLLDKISGLV